MIDIYMQTLSQDLKLLIALALMYIIFSNPSINIDVEEKKQLLPFSKSN